MASYKVKIAFVLWAAETGRSSNCSDDAQLRRVQPQVFAVTVLHVKRQALCRDLYVR